MHRVVLIWKTIPDTVDVFLLEVDDETYKLMLTCHRKYINGDNTPEEDAALEKLSQYLDGKVSEPDDTVTEINKPSDLIISGFYL